MTYYIRKCAIGCQLLMGMKLKHVVQVLQVKYTDCADPKALCAKIGEELDLGSLRGDVKQLPAGVVNSLRNRARTLRDEAVATLRDGTRDVQVGDAQDDSPS